MISFFKKNFFEKLNNSWKFEYCIVLLYILIGMIGWFFSYSFSGVGVVLLTISLLFIFNDFKYIIPALLCMIFSYNGGFLSTSFPTEIVIYAVALIVIILIYSICNFKLSNLKKPKSYIGIMLLAIFCIIPIFWNNVITEENIVLYLVYFSWFLYIIVYFVLGINFGKNSLRMVIFSMSSLTILLSFECFVKIIEIYREISTEDYYIMYAVGWGSCNEAGIMLCMCLPFIFYEIIKTDNTLIAGIGIIKIAINVAGIILSTSRASIAIGAIETFALIILMLIFSKKKITNLVFISFFILLSIILIQLSIGLDGLFEYIKNSFSLKKIQGDERIELFKRAITMWKKDLKTIIFGSGIVSELEYRWSIGVYDVVYIVYHSTFFEALVCGGILGICALSFHFFEKYKQLWKKEKAFTFIMVSGYIFLDAYGMIDNTYGMYYYMIPLILIMTALDNDNNTDIYSNGALVEKCESRDNHNSENDLSIYV